jgi:hypothetical protein
VLWYRKNSIDWPWDIILNWSWDWKMCSVKTLRTKLIVDVYMGILNACVY